MELKTPISFYDTKASTNVPASLFLKCINLCFNKIQSFTNYIKRGVLKYLILLKFLENSLNYRMKFEEFLYGNWKFN